MVETCWIKTYLNKRKCLLFALVVRSTSWWKSRAIFSGHRKINGLSILFWMYYTYEIYILSEYNETVRKSVKYETVTLCKFSSRSMMSLGRYSEKNFFPIVYFFWNAPIYIYNTTIANIIILLLQTFKSFIIINLEKMVTGNGFIVKVNFNSENV